MEWHDEAIIIKIKKFNEQAAIIHLLSQNHGLYKGIARNLLSSNAISTIQIGNLVHATWKARLAEHLGNFNLELNKQIIGHIIDDQNKLLILQSICSILDSSLAERQPENKIFTITYEFLEFLKQNKDKNNIFINRQYILFELNLLSALGFGLDTSKCAVLGTNEDLFYVSPKTGKAVSKSIGAPYHKKLLQLPKFIINHKEDITNKDIFMGLTLSGYFLYKHIYQPKNFLMPNSRSKILYKIHPKIF